METLRYVLMANGLLAVVSITYYALLRRETFFGVNRLALWLGLTGALVLPLLRLPDWRPQPVRHLMQRTAAVIVPNVLPKPLTVQPEVTIAFPNRKVYRAFRIQQPVSWSWQLGLVMLYIVGVIGLLIRFCIQLMSLRKLISHSVHEPYDHFTVVSNETVTSPFSFFDWVVVNPSQHTPCELDQILRHERVHVRERHSIDMIGAELVCIIFWFNPAAYLFRHFLHQTLEFYADRAVLAEGVDAKAYQYNLLKVSLLANQSAITNHFSKAQLKSRIVMLNRQTSPKTTWLKYPVFLMAALTVASAFARPQHLRALRKYVPKPIVETLSAMVVPPVRPIHSSSEADQSTEHTPADFTPEHNSARKQLTPPAEQPSDSVLDVVNSGSNRISPSRYMVYQGDYLYWIVTPKTTFDDLMIMKQEFAKHGHTMLLNEVKYDPLHTYISRIDFIVQRPTGNLTRCDDLQEDDKPILSLAGYIGLKTNQVGSSRLEGRYSKSFPLYQTQAEKEFPTILRGVAATDIATIYRLIDDKKMEYMVLEGKRKYSHLGIGFRQFDKEEIKKQSTPNSAISIKSDGSIVINEAPGIIKAFINNEPVSLDDVQQLKLIQLYTVAVILGNDAATNKRTGIDYLLFYVDQSK